MPVVEWIALIEILLLLVNKISNGVFMCRTLASINILKYCYQILHFNSIFATIIFNIGEEFNKYMLIL